MFLLVFAMCHAMTFARNAMAFSFHIQCDGKMCLRPIMEFSPRRFLQFRSQQIVAQGLAARTRISIRLRSDLRSPPGAWDPARVFAVRPHATCTNHCRRRNGDNSMIFRKNLIPLYWIDRKCHGISCDGHIMTCGRNQQNMMFQKREAPWCVVAYF